MAGDFLLKDYQSAVTLFTTGSAAVSSGAFSVLSAEMNNLAASGGNWPFADFVFTCASMTPGSAPFWLALFKLVAADGTNYEDDGGTTNGPPVGTPQWTKSVTSGASAKRAAFLNVPLSPGKQKFVILNKLGASIPAEWTLTAYPWSRRYT